MIDETKPETFVVGDTVQLTPDGPDMKVIGVNEDKVECAWFEGRRLRTATFPAAALELAGAESVQYVWQPPQGMEGPDVVMTPEMKEDGEE